MMNYQTASKAVKASIEEANKLKARMNIAVVDVGANLVYFVRMVKSYLGSVDISIKKAKTSFGGAFSYLRHNILTTL